MHEARTYASQSLRLAPPDSILLFPDGSVLGGNKVGGCGWAIFYKNGSDTVEDTDREGAYSYFGPAMSYEAEILANTH